MTKCFVLMYQKFWYHIFLKMLIKEFSKRISLKSQKWSSIDWDQFLPYKFIAPWGFCVEDV